MSEGTAMSVGVDGFALTTTEAWFDTDLPDRAPDPDALAAEWVRRVPVFGPHREDLSRLLGVGLFTGKILGAHRVAVLAALARDDEDATDRLYHGTLFTGLMPADFEARDAAGMAAELRERVGGEQLPGVLEVGDVLLGGIPAVRHRTLDTIPSITPEQGTLVDTVKYFVPVPDGGDKLVLLWFATPTLGPEGDGMIELMDEVAATFRWLP